MAFEVSLQTVSVPASADLSTKQFLFGTINASGQVAVVGAGLASDGVIALGPSAQGRPCGLASFPGQIARVMAGASFANGALLEADANGKAITQARSGKSVLAVTNKGTVVIGRRLNEDTFTIQLMDDHENLVTLEKDDLKSMTVLKRFADAFAEREIHGRADQRRGRLSRVAEIGADDDSHFIWI